MGLPKIKHPLFDLVIPSTGKKVKYRPFTVKEEKILLIAQESKDMEHSLNAIRQIINNCVQGVDVNELAIFDIEYIFISLRAKSVNNIVEFQITDPETQEKVPMSVDLGEMKVVKNEAHTKKVYLTDDIILMMRYPNIERVGIVTKKTDETEQATELLKHCMDSIVEGDSVYKFDDYTEEEVNEFFNDLSSDSAKKIQTFFDTMPKLRHEISYVNSAGNKKVFVLEGTDSFFI